MSDTKIQMLPQSTAAAAQPTSPRTGVARVKLNSTTGRARVPQSRSWGNARTGECQILEMKGTSVYTLLYLNIAMENHVFSVFHGTTHYFYGHFQ